MAVNQLWAVFWALRMKVGILYISMQGTELPNLNVAATQETFLQPAD